MIAFEVGSPSLSERGYTVTIEQTGTWERLQKLVTFPYRFAEETYEAYRSARARLTNTRYQSTPGLLQHVFIRFPCDLIGNLYKAYGKLYKAYLYPPPAKIISQPEIAKALLKYARHDPHGPLIQGAQNPFLSLVQKLYPEADADDLLFSCRASFVDLYRKPLMEMMKSGAVREQEAAFKDLAKELIQRESGTVDACRLALHYSTAVVSKLILGHPGPIETYEEIGEAASFLLNGPKQGERPIPPSLTTSATLSGSYGVSIDISHLFDLRGDAHSKAKAEVEEELKNKTAQFEEMLRNFETAQRAKQIAALETLRQAVETSLSSPLAEKLRTESGLNEMQIKSTILALYFAGSETASSLLTYLLWQLGRHPEWQQEPLKTKNLYAESIRLFTPASSLERKTNQDLVCKVINNEGKELHREIIPKGTSLSYHIDLTAKQYPNSHTFDPERFSTLPNPLPWLPFGSGKHLCPGQWLAEAEIIAFVEALMETYTIDSLPEGTLSTQVGLTNRPGEKVTLFLQKRKQD